jgi:hypothetical protein
MESNSTVPPEDAEGNEPPGPTALPPDPEVPEADALDQARDVLPPASDRGAVDRAIEVPEADAIDQATVVDLEPDDEE